MLENHFSEYSCSLHHVPGLFLLCCIVHCLALEIHNKDSGDDFKRFSQLPFSEHWNLQKWLVIGGSTLWFPMVRGSAVSESQALLQRLQLGTQKWTHQNGLPPEKILSLDFLLPDTFPRRPSLKSEKWFPLSHHSFQSAFPPTPPPKGGAFLGPTVSLISQDRHQYSYPPFIVVRLIFHCLCVYISGG